MKWLFALAAMMFGMGRKSATRAEQPRSSRDILRPQESEPAQAARELLVYLRLNPGAVLRSDLNVATFQARMGRIDVDGIVGPQTRARARALGVTLP